jgi:peptidoglycan-N-acetylglucosamine deacetylase
MNILSKDLALDQVGFSRRRFLLLAATIVVGSSNWDSLEDELIAVLEGSAPVSGREKKADPSHSSSETKPNPDEAIIDSPRRRLFLTFDDGPLFCTGRILDMLAESQQKATFFVIGRNLLIPKLRDFAIRALEEGHDIGNHSYSHPNFSSISAQRAEVEIYKTHTMIDDLVREAGVDPARQNLFFRFPYGNCGSIYNYAKYRKTLASLNYRIAWWDLDTWDWRMEVGWLKRNSTKVVASLKKAKPGDVILLHDRVKTCDHLPEMMGVISSQKLMSVPLSDYGARMEPLTDDDVLIDRIELVSPYKIGSKSIPRQIRRSSRNNFFIGSVGKVPRRSRHVQDSVQKSM